MKMITKILTLGALLGLAACSPNEFFHAQHPSGPSPLPDNSPVVPPGFILAPGLPKPAEVTSATSTHADAYVLMFVGHTADPAAPVDQQIGLLSRPQIYATLVKCNDSIDKLTEITKTDKGKEFLTKLQIDKKVMICVPISF